MLLVKSSILHIILFLLIIIILWLLFIPEPEARWTESQVDVDEGGARQVCFTTDIGSAQSYNIIVSAREKQPRPATQSMWVILYRSGFWNVNLI